MDIDTELRVIAAIRFLAHTYGLPGGGMDRVDELLDQRLEGPRSSTADLELAAPHRPSMPAVSEQFSPSGGP
jgi:hypothetical protein